MASFNLPWSDPLLAGAALAQQAQPWVLLFSAQKTGYSGRYSYLAWEPEEILTHTSLAHFQKKLEAGASPEVMWFGTLGYELAAEFEPRLSFPSQAFLQLPVLWMARFRQVARYDHDQKIVELLSPHPVTLPSSPLPSPLPVPPIQSSSASLSKSEYLASIEKTLERIRNGDFYQANITRKLFGEFAATPQPYDIFLKLVKANPAPYCAFMNCGTHQVISSSPERFLAADAQGNLRTRPIKGSARRGVTASEDEMIKNELRESGKNRAENLMITDLMRNDFSRVCKPESVKVKKLCELDSFATVHHLSSEVDGQLSEGQKFSDIISACFPPGSMTGAPKLSAMQWCSSSEKWRRGIYSGALGWVQANGECEFSVVIRTLFLQGKKFEFQAGGGIVAESTPPDEWEELLIKSQPIFRILNTPEM